MTTLAKKKILIADDEEDLRLILKEELEFAGCEVFLAKDGAEALEILKTEKVDVVLSDIRMPGATGIEILESIRLQNNSVPRVILMTGFADITFQDAYHKGADAIFSKPFHIPDLMTTLERVLEGQTQNRGRRFNRYVTLESIELSHPDGTGKRTGQALNVGRGGAFISTKGDLPKSGETLNFRIYFRFEERFVIEGSGLVRWVRSDGISVIPRGFGLEFLTLKSPAQCSLEEVFQTVEKSCKSL